MFKDEGNNAVMHIESITYQCTGTVPILMSMLISSKYAMPQEVDLNLKNDQPNPRAHTQS